MSRATLPNIGVCDRIAVEYYENPIRTTVTAAAAGGATSTVVNKVAEATFGVSIDPTLALTSGAIIGLTGLAAACASASSEVVTQIVTARTLGGVQQPASVTLGENFAGDLAKENRKLALAEAAANAAKKDLADVIDTLQSQRKAQGKDPLSDRAAMAMAKQILTMAA